MSGRPSRQPRVQPAARASNAATRHADACPIATVALEIASSSEPIRATAAGAFTSWLDVVTDRVVAAGIPATQANEISVELFCLVEGAFLLCRTTRDATPMEIAGRRAAATVAAALGR